MVQFKDEKHRDFRHIVLWKTEGMSVTPYFTAHPSSVGESYGQHMVTALSFGTHMVLAGVASMLHGLFPFLFVSTAAPRCAISMTR